MDAIWHLDSSKGIVFFFSAGMDVGHSFIQIRKSCFFFPRSGKKRKKKTQACFFFPQEKFIGHSFGILMNSIFFNKSWLYFFSPNFCVFLCLFFFSPGKVHRSFIWNFDEFPFFFNKSWLWFFFPGFLCVFLCFFFFLEKFTCHSFIQFLMRKKKQPGKKKTAFSFIHSIFLKNAQKRTFPGK